MEARERVRVADSFWPSFVAPRVETLGRNNTQLLLEPHYTRNLRHLINTGVCPKRCMKSSRGVDHTRVIQAGLDYAGPVSIALRNRSFLSPPHSSRCTRTGATERRYMSIAVLGIAHWGQHHAGHQCQQALSSACTHRSSVRNLPGSTQFVSLGHEPHFEAQTAHRRAQTAQVLLAADVQQPPGTCMHCTCDGRCGRHAAGRCGGRREGSGRGCKRENCTRDDRCLHSNRATCCHCRNLVSSAGRATKRPRVSVPLIQSQSRVQLVPAPLPPVHRQMAVTTSKPQQQPATSDDLLEAELRAFLQDANLGGELSLCEYKEWASRRQHFNLVVLVCGTQFNLHKHPMLFESRKLHSMARHVLETNADSSNFGGAVPVLELSAFPGGAEMFETLAIYCYTGEISFSLANLAAMNCAIEFLEMREDIRQSAKRFLDQQISQGNEGLSNLLQVVNSAQTLAQAQPELFHSASETLIETCMSKLVRRGETLDADAMLQLFTLPSELFIELTQRLLSSKPPQSTAVRTSSEIASELCVQAKLAQIHRDAQRSLSPSHCSRVFAQQCVQLLQGKSVEAVDAIKDEKPEMACEEPLELSMLFTSDKSDKMLMKLMDDDLSACVVSSGSSPVDASICFVSESFRFGAHTHTLPETFVV